MPNIFAWLWFFSAPLPCWDYCKSLPSKRQIALYSPGWLASPFILLVQIISPFSFSSTKKKYFPSPNIFFLFLLRFSSPPQKKIFSFSKYFLPFPFALFTWSSLSSFHTISNLGELLSTWFQCWTNPWSHDFHLMRYFSLFHGFCSF